MQIHFEVTQFETAFQRSGQIDAPGDLLRVLVETEATMSLDDTKKMAVQLHVSHKDQSVPHSLSFTEFTQSTTFHGIKYVFQSQQFSLRR